MKTTTKTLVALAMVGMFAFASCTPNSINDDTQQIDKTKIKASTFLQRRRFAFEPNFQFFRLFVFRIFTNFRFSLYDLESWH